MEKSQDSVVEAVEKSQDSYDKNIQKAINVGQKQTIDQRNSTFNINNKRTYTQEQLEATAFELCWDLMLLFLQNQERHQVEQKIIQYAKRLDIELPKEWVEQIEKGIETQGASIMSLMYNLAGQIIASNQVAGKYFEFCFNLMFNNIKREPITEHLIKDLNLPDELRKPRSNESPNFEWTNAIHEYFKAKLP